MRNTEILIGTNVWSCQNDFSLILFIFSLPVNTILKNNSGYIKLSFSIGYFERFVNCKSDYLELLLSVYAYIRKMYKSNEFNVNTGHYYVVQKSWLKHRINTHLTMPTPLPCWKKNNRQPRIRARRTGCVNAMRWRIFKTSVTILVITYRSFVRNYQII